MITSRRAALLSGLALASFGSNVSRAAIPKVRLGQATTTLSFLKLWAARALDSFDAEGLALEWAQVPGGDPAALAALDASDLDIAAVGSDTALAAITHGQPFQIVYSLMSKIPYDLTVSKAFLQRQGVTQADPLGKRVGLMKDAIIGVSAIGGAQDRVARWLAARGGLNARDLKVALIGAPPALGAALESGRIDAFMLSPPESVIAEAKGYGEVMVNISREFPDMQGIPSLVLVAKDVVDGETRARLVRTMRALTHAGAILAADPDKVASLISSKYFPKIDPAIMRESVRRITDGAIGDGRLDKANIATLLQFSSQAGGAEPSGNAFWTNSYVDSANTK